MPQIDLNNVLCVSCLCIGRRLQKLSESLTKFYMDALYEIPLSNVDCIDPVVCWECEAILKKCLSFREQVKDSYRILQTYTVENLNECLLSDVSRPPRLIVHNNDAVNINPFNEVKVKFETEILKTDTDYQLSDTDDINNDEIQTVLCDIKNEFVSTEDEKDSLSMKNFADIKDEKTDFDLLVEKRATKDNDKRKLNRVRDKGRSKIKGDSTKYPTYKSLPRQVIHRNDQVQRTPELKTQRKRVQCGECDKTFSHRAGLMNHRITVHEAQNEFPCKVCKKVFRWKTSLKRHLEKHAANTQTPEAFCSLCGIGFGSVASLQRHLRNSLKHVTPDQLKTQQSSQGSEKIRVNNNKRERQQRYREKNRDKLKAREAKRRERIQYSQIIARPSTSSNTNRLELKNEEIITAQSSSGSEKIEPSSIQRNDLNALQKKRERQQRYREKNRDKLKAREAKRRERIQYSQIIARPSTSSNTNRLELNNEEIITAQSSSGSEKIEPSSIQRNDLNALQKKRERQQRYREKNRDKLKAREAKRRERIQYSQIIARPSTSSNTNRLELKNEEIITAQSSSGSEKIRPSFKEII
ncbi:peptidyl-prolyl cis-trans isomerase G isoform X1 [Pieris rapae]|uniref:peptidyl-prolyl cis-trans isomerase G isoform X1 n=1 Tax=Pieris rapae TaxID=64459 RepID=UPI001E2800EA|nr:peptidyl-prolyl cis-trans isomerase G isoform X1 [Pieris rapae]